MPTNSDMLTFLRVRFGGQRQMSDAIANFRAQQQYKGAGATMMDAALVLYTQETCSHAWSRRRDGRRCHKCEKIEFGVSA